MAEHMSIGEEFRSVKPGRKLCWFESGFCHQTKEIKMENYIQIKDLEIGCIYELQARNIKYGMYAGNGIFVGKRTKFGLAHIDQETHWDQKTEHEMCGTAKPIRKVLDADTGTVYIL